MARYDRGNYREYGPVYGGDWSNPNGGYRRSRYDRGFQAYRPQVGGYREGFQGGSGGYSTGGYAPRGPRGGGGGRYGRDYWWIGEHALGPASEGSRYDEAYRRFDEETHPRYSPVGGMYHAMGGRYAYNRAPRPLREETWFSDWTRWF